MRHFPLRELGYAFGFLLLLAALYVGAYYAMVVRDGSVYAVRAVHSTGEITPFASVFPKYRWSDESAVAFFSLAFEVDQRIRSDYWTGEAYLAAREKLP
jgi:hypothetical protein